MTAATSYSPDDLLETAKALLARPDANVRGFWPRAAAHLCRQALEASLDSWWRSRLPGMEATSMRAQLACLPTYLGNGDLAGRLAYTWSGLSNACHHHTYELAPTSAELEAWISAVQSFVLETKPPNER
jgi:hypothetical protein